MLQYSLYQNRMTQRRIEREAVYYTAEAGVDQVIHYFNFPAEYADNTAFFTQDATTASYYADTDADGIGDTNVFTTRMVSGSRILVDSSTSPNPLTFGYLMGDGENRAEVTDLTVSLPTAADLTQTPRAIMVVTSQAENAVGQTRIVRATLGADPPFLLQVPAAIISLAPTASANGQGNVHWGEAWFDTNFQLPNGGLNNLTTISDPWVNFRSTGHVLMSNGKYANGSNGSNTPLPSTAPNYYQPWGDNGAGGEFDPNHTNIHQHTDYSSLDWPDPLDYDWWRNAAQTRGLYFSWNAAGNKLVSGQSGQELTTAQFFDEINQMSEVTTGASGADQNLPDPTIIFVDTLDGNEPQADGSNWCDLQVTGGAGGNDIFLRGVFYVGGDVTFNIRGMDGLWLQDPDRVDDPNSGSEQQVDDIFLNGLFYCEGMMSMVGSPGVYGALLARNGFGTGGNGEVWYDARLKSGFPFSFNSNVSLARWQELHPDISGI